MHKIKHEDMESKMQSINLSVGQRRAEFISPVSLWLDFDKKAKVDEDDLGTPGLTTS